MRILAGIFSLGRFLIGIVFISQPKVMDRGWIGRTARRPGAQVLSRAVGARDLALGLGGLQAVVRNDGSARQWLAAASLCDAVDFGATWAAGNRIPRHARTTVLGIAGTFAVLSGVLAAATQAPGQVDPAQAAHAHDVTEAGAVPAEPVGTA